MLDVDGFTMGAAMAVGANMRDQDRALQEWKNAVYERDAVIEKLATKQRQLEQEILTLVSQSQADAAKIAGLNAFIETVQQRSPNCEALKPTGDKFGNGVDVTVAGVAYREAFDAKASDLGRTDLIELRRVRATAA